MAASSPARVDVPHQIRRAWVVLGAATICFLVLAGLAIGALRYVYVHATQPERASVEIVSGSAALYRRAEEASWVLLDEDTELREGDEISTALGTVLRISTFDGTVINVWEDSLVQIDRMRSSRFLDRTKQIELTLQSGTVYVRMEPHGSYSYAEVAVQTALVDVTMSDEPSRSEAGTFLVEVLRDGAAATGLAREANQVRVAALSGAAMVEKANEQTKLLAEEQTIVSTSGRFGEITEPFRQLVTNGDFSSGLTNWTEFRRSTIPGADPTGAEISLVEGGAATDNPSRLRLHRPDDFNVPVTIGVRQRIGQTVQTPGSMELRLALRIDAQSPPTSGENADLFPFAYTLTYVDRNGEDRELTRGYFAGFEGAERVPAIRGSQVPLGAWQRIVFNLDDLEPAPQHIDSFLVYASGVSFDVSVTNISLTTREQLGVDE